MGSSGTGQRTSIAAHGGRLQRGAKYNAKTKTVIHEQTADGNSERIVQNVAIATNVSVLTERF